MMRNNRFDVPGIHPRGIRAGWGRGAASSRTTPFLLVEASMVLRVGCAQLCLMAAALPTASCAEETRDEPGGAENYMASGECRVYVSRRALEGGDGSSWGSALVSATEGLQLAEELEAELDTDSWGEPDQACAVWVAEGAYSLFDESAVEDLPLIVRTAMYGGFRGTEAALSERDWTAYPTTLDARSFRQPGKGLWVAAMTYEGALLDGFFLTGLGGCPESTLPREHALWTNGDTRIANCVLHDNASEKGGAAIYQETGDLEIEDVYFVGNEALGNGGALLSENCRFSVLRAAFTGNRAGGDGGAIACGVSFSEPGDVLIDASTFSYNWAGGDGGAVSVTGATASFRWTNFEENVALGNGGGARVETLSTSGVGGAALRECSFRECRAVRGGGLYLAGAEENALHATLDGIAFVANAGDLGGGLFAAEAALTLDGCAFEANAAEENGGGAAFDSVTASMTRALFASNSAPMGGGFLSVFSRTTLAASLLYGNEANESGGAMLSSLGELSLRRTTVAENTAPDGGAFRVDGGAAKLFGSVIWGNGGGIAGAYEASCSDLGVGPDGAIGADPMFASPETADFHLKAGSPCIDAVPDDCVALVDNEDFDGNPPHEVPGVGEEGASMDMGAFEYVP
jgi:predicted outer membrane repeat protein